MQDSYIRTIERDKAICAFDFVEDGIEENADYASHVKKVPMLILNNGLLPTLAFMYQKGEDISYKVILRQLISWCSEVEDKMEFNNKKFDTKNNKETFKNIAYLTQREYRFWTKEILSLLVWMKRFSEGKEIELKAKEEKSDE